MSNLLRAFALSLVVTGAFASAHLSHSTGSTVVAPKISAAPPAGCPWNSPNGCGIAGPDGN